MRNTDNSAILIVDDDINNVEILKMDLEDEGYDLLAGYDGVEGWNILQQNKDRIVVILLDRMMPKMNGMEFIAKLKANEYLAQIPVVMQTAAAEKSQVAEGIKAGVYYYLTKPYEEVVMKSVVQAAIGSYLNAKTHQDELIQHRQKLHLVKECSFEIQTLSDARYLATFLANYYPKPSEIITGISELLVNAIEHGNLGLSYEDKTRLNNENQWQTEIESLLILPQYKDKKVLVQFERNQASITLTITDEGDGFDWHPYMTFDPDRATHNHGRGIALANLIHFDSLEYCGKGNKVITKVHL